MQKFRASMIKQKTKFFQYQAHGKSELKGKSETYMPIKSGSSLARKYT